MNGMLTTLAQLPRLPETVPPAAAAPTGAADPAPSSKSLAPPVDPCTTKPFGQCAGMNFTQTKEERDAYNFTAGATRLSCCPAVPPSALTQRVPRRPAPLHAPCRLRSGVKWWSLWELLYELRLPSRPWLDPRSDRDQPTRARAPSAPH